MAANASSIFQQHFRQFGRILDELHESPVDRRNEQHLRTLLDDLNYFKTLVQENSALIHADDLAIYLSSLPHMVQDALLLYNDTCENSHQGRPSIVETRYTGRPGRPALDINPGFMQWATQHSNQTRIARFLGLSKRKIRQTVLDLGLDEPGSWPHGGVPLSAMEQPHFPEPLSAEGRRSSGDELNDVDNSMAGDDARRTLGPQHDVSDQELDNLVLSLRTHFRRAGVSMLSGMLRSMGYHIREDVLRASLKRIDPVQRIFQRLTVRKREYKVAGPNSVWHHDGQHLLIQWNIVFLGFMDSHTRLIVSLEACNNNRSCTVLDIFLGGTFQYGVPSRVRGDHGGENVGVATWMEGFRGEGRGFYIWGRSVHNVRIERLWVDLTAQLGSTWAEQFTLLEMHHGLNPNNANHIWLLHRLFLSTINMEVAFFVQAWNHHKITMRKGVDGRGPKRSPIDMFGFDMLVSGLRGEPLWRQEEENLSEEELVDFGVDWEALQDSRITDHRDAHNDPQEGSSTWARSGVPENLNTVILDPPSGPFENAEEFDQMLRTMQAEAHDLSDTGVCSLWRGALACAREISPHLF